MKFLHEIRTFSNGTVMDNGWWKISEDGIFLENECGGRHSYQPNDNDIIVEAYDWSQLDYSYLIKPESQYGWIDRDGKIYGCDYAGHAEIARRILHRTEIELEKSGWIKLYRGYHGGISIYFNYSNKIIGQMTPEQEATLKSMDLNI